MSHQQMLSERAPGAKFIGSGELEGYWLVFDGYSSFWRGPVANIVKSADDVVWGGLFEITRDHLERLDQYEGYPQYYSRMEMSVQRPGREKLTAWMYVRPAQVPGRPSKAYLDRVLQGARDCRLPGDYILSTIDIFPEHPLDRPVL
ncbi:MAG: gamma-glutamylcyclotransferase [Candidatus Omnitrophica bacterium]|nr:gamma-glutamylcyclotransferase [Candidatus Omnitrophota bacterium]